MMRWDRWRVLPRGDLEQLVRVVVRVAIATFVICLPLLHVHAARRNAEEQVQGQVVEVQKRRLQSPDYMTGGSNPSDAPLTSRSYAFEVSIRVGCNTYVGIYETPFNYLPSEFTANQRIEFRLTKHVMYFDVPDTAGIRMHIAHRRSECGAGK
jgi:hypothetical protein